MLKNCNDNVILTESQKEEMITKSSVHVGNLLTELGFKWQEDPHLSGTPRRVAKAYVNDILCGCYNQAPNVTAFDNVEKYDGIVFSGNIEVTSICAHHMQSFLGKAHVAYIPSATGKVIGLSKLNRIVDFFARRFNVQENLTMQIHNYIDGVCEGNSGVAVVIDSNHSCVKCRGVKQNSTMMTSKLSGDFLTQGDQARFEFYKFIDNLKK